MEAIGHALVALTLLSLGIWACGIGIAITIIVTGFLARRAHRRKR